MGTADGTVIGTAKVVDNGPDANRLVIAVVAEGYLEDDLDQFADDVDDFVATFFATPPFDQIGNQQAFNIYRVDVASNEEGADDPDTCDGGTGATVATFFDASYCFDGQIRRLLSADATIVESTLDAQVPGWDQALVIVNSGIRGGAGGQIAVAANGGSDWKEVCVHELGHSLFGLADEYESYAGCDSGEEGQDVHPGPEPDQPNVTLNTNRTTIKWGHLIDAATAVPTTENADCTGCDPQASPVASGTVGVFEGAQYHHCGAYRPEFDCIMRRSAFGSFCAVCEEQICKVLAAYRTTVTLSLPSIVFNDVPEGVTAPGPAVFTVDNECATIHFEVVAGPTVLTGPPGTEFGTPFGTEFSSAPVFNPRQAFVWFTYTGTADGDTATGQVRIRCVETEQEFQVPISANTVARPSVAVALVLDKSASMAQPSGIPNHSREDVLHFSAPPFVDVLPEGNALGIVSFDQNAYIEMAVSGPTGPIDLPDLTRSTARSTILSHVHNPDGLTAIGDGLQAAHDLLDPVTGFDLKATIVLTDGHETAARFISDVTDLITERVYAIGLGTADQVKPAALSALADGTGGSMLMTGELNLDQYFRLTKYYLQILAGVRNADIVLDPEGFLQPGVVHAIDFELAETDIDSDVILLSRFPQVLNFALRTPHGQVIGPATPVVGVSFVQTPQTSCYRVTLPSVVEGVANREGTWRALLTIDEKRLKRLLDHLQEQDGGPSEAVTEALAHGVRYSLNVYAFTNLRLRASLSQTANVPGATMTLRVLLTEYGLPVEARAVVRATITRPDATTVVLAMPEIEPGVFEASFAANQAGVYTAPVEANGHTLRGRPFRRHQIVTGAVYQGGDDPFPGGGDGSGGGGGPGREDLCELLRCLLSDTVLRPELRKRLLELGVDLDAARRCLDEWCRKRPGGATQPGLIEQAPGAFDPALAAVVRSVAQLVVDHR